MALPKLETSRFESVIPSTGQRVSYRPYLVKEEKILMMAMETSDQKQIVRATKDIIKSCVFDDIDVNSLAVFDVEHLFLELRSKSVGESIDLKIKCEHCEALNEQNVDFSEINVDVPESNNIIMLTDDIGLTMRYPSFDDVSKLDGDDQESIETAFNIIQTCIENIFNEDDVWLAKDEGPKKMKEFVESMTSSQFVMIQEFFEKMPALKAEIKFECVSCGEHNTTELKGLQSFFT
jgi:ribosomal protein L44E